MPSKDSIAATLRVDMQSDKAAQEGRRMTIDTTAIDRDYGVPEHLEHRIPEPPRRPARRRAG